MEKIGLVVRQYGREVNGGGEDHCRAIAEHLKPYYGVEVLTSSSREYPYNDYYPSGMELIDGISVRRFSVKREIDFRRRELLEKQMLEGELSEEEWLTECGPYCPDLIDYLYQHREDYKCVLFFSYSNYLTCKGLELELPNVVFIPLAHDERNLYWPIYKKVFKKPAAFLFNTDEERDLVDKLFRIEDRPYQVGIFGLDETAGKQEPLPESYASLRPYILYAGRVTYTKNYQELNRYFLEYKKRHKTDLKLIVTGRIRTGFPLLYHEDIIYAGFVPEEEKRALLGHAVCLVLPSKNESLSIVTLESFMQERPVLVNGRCPVLEGHCKRGNAGLYYTNYAEFEAELDYFLEHPDVADQMGWNGRRYVEENYQWDKVVSNILGLIEEVGNHEGS